MGIPFCVLEKYLEIYNIHFVSLSSTFRDNWTVKQRITLCLKKEIKYKLKMFKKGSLELTSRNSGLCCQTLAVAYTTAPKRLVAYLSRPLVPYSAILAVYRDRRQPFLRRMSVNSRNNGWEKTTSTKKFLHEIVDTSLTDKNRSKFTFGYSVVSWSVSCRSP